MGIEFVEIPVEKYIDETAVPTDQQLKETYNKYATIEPDLKQGLPGFLQPRRIDVQYLLAKVDDFAKDETVTDEEIARYYEEKKENSRIFPGRRSIRRHRRLHSSDRTIGRSHREKARSRHTCCNSSHSPCGASRARNACEPNPSTPPAETKPETPAEPKPPETPGHHPKWRHQFQLQLRREERHRFARNFRLEKWQPRWR